MSLQSQDPISEIEHALVTMRRDQQRRRLQRRDHEAKPHRVRDRTLGGAARFRMLAALAETGSLSVTDIAQKIGVDQPRASRLVNESVERGFARRTPDPTDGRRSVIELSATGRRMLEAAQESRRSAVVAATGEFSPEELATFANLLKRFVTAWPQE